METLPTAEMLSFMSPDYSGMLFVMIFVTWWLVIVNLLLGTILLVHAVFSRLTVLKDCHPTDATKKKK